MLSDPRHRPQVARTKHNASPTACGRLLYRPPGPILCSDSHLCSLRSSWIDFSSICTDTPGARSIQTPVLNRPVTHATPAAIPAPATDLTPFALCAEGVRSVAGVFPAGPAWVTPTSRFLEPFLALPARSRAASPAPYSGRRQRCWQHERRTARPTRMRRAISLSRPRAPGARASKAPPPRGTGLRSRVRSL